MTRSTRTQLRFPKKRIVAILIDWIIWAYLSYCAFYLIDYLYRTFFALSIHDKLVFPSYGWAAAILGSLIVAILWENLGISIGHKANDLVLLDGQHARPSTAKRICHAFLDLPTWGGSVLAAALPLLAPIGLGTWIYNLVVGVGVSFVPGITLWSPGSWGATLGYSLLSVAAIVAIGFVSVFIFFFFIRWLWGTRTEPACWSDRVCRVRLLSSDEIPGPAAPPRRWFHTSVGIMAFVLVVTTFAVGWLLTDVDFGHLIQRAPYMSSMVGRLLSPDFSSFVKPDFLLNDSILTAMVETVFMALMATLIGLVVAFPLSFLGARNLVRKGPLGWIVYTVTRAFFNIFRSIEVLIWALIFAVWVGFGPFAGVIALAIHTVAALGKLFSEQVESIDPGPVEAITAAGGRRWQIIAYGVIPQVVPSFTAFSMYRWDINVRMSTIVGLVGGGGIGRMLFHYTNELQWERVGAVILIIIAVVWTMDYLSGRIRERIA